MRSATLPAFLALVLAGCVSPAPPPDVVPAGGNGVLPVLTKLVCPPGGDVERLPGVCVGTLARPGQALTEPKLSIDPLDPERLVLGVNAGNALVLDADALMPPDPSPFRSDVFLSTDAGATWRHLRPPVPLAERGRFASADTDPVFDRDGTLHVTGLVIVPSVDGTVAQHVFHAASQDEGRTWSEPVVFLDHGDDNRNWNTVAPDGTLLVAWSRTAAVTTEVAWTSDDGASWGRMSVEGCSSDRSSTSTTLPCWHAVAKASRSIVSTFRTPPARCTRPSRWRAPRPTSRAAETARCGSAAPARKGR